MKSKYHSKKITINGITYDSKKEARRHARLLEMERNGEIKELNRQVKFVLIPAQREPDKVGPRGGVRKGKVIEREVSYLADFTYFQDGQYVVEDVKSAITRKEPLFVVKRKLLLWVHGIRLKET